MPKDMDVGVEDNVTIICDAEGDPQPHIQWYINGIPINESELLNSCSSHQI